MDENLEDMTLEELSQKLEAIGKDNEQITRENQLFESHILRRRKDDRRLDDDYDMENTRKKKNKNKDRPVRLTAEQKYEIANAELETLRKNIDDGRDKSETLLERLKAILEGTDLSIAEIRKEAFDFGRFLSAAENGRTGKYDAEKLMKYMEDKFKAKDALIDKLQMKSFSLKNQIWKAEQQIRHKEEMGDDLKFIDFHQLQIENKKHVKDIDERNKKLLSMKLNSGKTVQTLNSLKKKLTDALTEQKEIQTDIKVKNEKIKRTKAENTACKKDFEKAKKTNKTYLMQQLAEDIPKPPEFVEQKSLYQSLKISEKNQKRQIEIVEVAAK